MKITRFRNLSKIKKGLYPLIKGRNVNKFNNNIKMSTMWLEKPNIDKDTLIIRRFKYKCAERIIVCCIVNKDIYIDDTVFYLDANCSLSVLYFLCGVLNSFIAEYIISLINVDNTLRVSQLYNIPIIPYDENVSKLVEMIINDINNQKLKNQLDALIAKLYDINYEELEYILSTFNIVDDEIKEDILRRFDAI